MLRRQLIRVIDVFWFIKGLVSVLTFIIISKAIVIVLDRAFRGNLFWVCLCMSVFVYISTVDSQLSKLIFSKFPLKLNDHLDNQEIL